MIILNFSVRILNMPAASFIAKLSTMSKYLAPGILAVVNEFFNGGGDELFKKVVVDNFLFRYKRFNSGQDF